MREKGRGNKYKFPYKILYIMIIMLSIATLLFKRSMLISGILVQDFSLCFKLLTCKNNSFGIFTANKLNKNKITITPWETQKLIILGFAPKEFTFPLWEFYYKP